MLIKLDKIVEDLHLAKMLIVSQSSSNAQMIKTLLNRHGYKDILQTDDPFSVADYYEHEELDLIILDIKLSGMDGFGVMNSIRETAAEKNESEKIPPILILTEVDHQEHRRRALTEGANDYISFPFDVREFLARTKNLLEIWQAHKIIHHQKEILEYKVNKRTEALRRTQAELHDSRMEIVWRLGRAAEYRDNETGLHIIRMSKIASLLGKAIGLNDDEADLVLNASPMHDIGKLGIPDSILLKPGKLNEEEWELMKTHTQIGADILSGSRSPLLVMAHDIALTHHEKWDGTGYPNNLRGDEIPLAARLSTVADVFDALTSVRPYKQAWTVEKAMEYFDDQSGKQFDPAMVKLLQQELSEVISIKKKYQEPDEVSSATR